MNACKVSVSLNECGKGTVKINGQPVPCKYIRIEAGVDQPTLVTVTLFASVEAEVKKAAVDKS